MIEERFYGRLGEVVKESKIVLSDTPPSGTEGPYVTQYLYDTFGRLQQMVYPDGEVLSYGYDAAGLLRSAQGAKGNKTYVYVKRMEYDRFEQRAFVQYGNNVKAEYTYDPLNRRLTNLHSLHGQGTVLQDLSYAYDDVGNILSLTNAVPVPPASGIGGPTSQSYGYDDLYRLTHAEGSFQQAGATQMYRLDQSYDSIHNITRKQQIHERVTPSGTVVPQQGTSYYWTYAYEGMHPHAPSRIGDRAFFYDLNGNQTGWLSDNSNTRRGIVWDEENRIQSISDGGDTTTFKYNDRGERVVKRGSKGETSYVNQYFTVRNGSAASKHVFAGTTRVVTQMVRPFSPPGGGNGNNNPPSEDKDQFFYHPDHLGSTNYVTDYQGKLYEHVEYFPFGETWVQEALNTDVTPYLFTSKILDTETGLYYFGARYYDPRTSVWQSPDPALEKYLPRRERGGRFDLLPGQGGIFNTGNLNLFSYVRDNPIVYMDPNGLYSSQDRAIIFHAVHQEAIQIQLGTRVPPDQLAIMQAAQHWIDAPEFQTNDRQFLHAMRGSGQDRAGAIRLANEWVKLNLGLAREAFRKGDTEKGAIFAGLAIHTMQDATSPMHRGFQEWNQSAGVTEKGKHVLGERQMPQPGSREMGELLGATQWGFDLSTGAAPIPEHVFDPNTGQVLIPQNYRLPQLKAGSGK